MKRIAAWLGQFRAAVSYWISPAGIGEERQSQLSPRFFTLWGVVYGIILSIVFAAGWKIFGELYFSEYNRLRLIPIVLVLLANAIFGFRSLLGLGVTVDRLVGGEPAENGSSGKIARVGFAGMLAVFLVMLIKFTSLLAMPYPTPWSPTGWRAYFNFLYPPKPLYRVLILYGLWGKAAYLIASATGPTSAQASESDRNLRRKMTVGSLVGNLALTFFVTSIYYSSWRNHALGFLVAMVIFATVYVASMLLAWRFKGHDQHSMFACAELAEVLVLFGYLIINSYM
jgi:cobalamin synthase